MKIDYNLKAGLCKISKPAYIMEIIEDLVNIQTKRTPLCPNTVLDKITSRPDLSVCVTRLAQFSNCYGSIRWNQLVHIVQYLKYTKDEGIYLNAETGSLRAFSDSDWGGDRPTRRSTTGYVTWKCQHCKNQ